MAAPTLRSVSSLRAERSLKLGEVLGILRDAAVALGELHAAGRIHGAVCAENIVLDDDGVARLCHDAPVPPAWSPEQEAGSPADVRSDVFGLGATVADLIADAGAVPDPLARLLAHMRADDPAARYQSMGEVLTALEAVELMSGYRAIRPGGEADALRNRRRMLVAVVVGLGVVMTSLALLVAFGPTPEGQGKPPESHGELVDVMEHVTPLPAAKRPGTRR